MSKGRDRSHRTDNKITQREFLQVVSQATLPMIPFIGSRRSATSAATTSHKYHRSAKGFPKNRPPVLTHVKACDMPRILQS